MTACRESLVFLKHAILALGFVLSTHALKREILKPSTVKVDFFMISNVYPFSPICMIILDHI